jgi:hypothetical protein
MDDELEITSKQSARIYAGLSAILAQAFVNSFGAERSYLQDR